MKKHFAVAVSFLGVVGKTELLLLVATGVKSSAPKRVFLRGQILLKSVTHGSLETHSFVKKIPEVIRVHFMRSLVVVITVLIQKDLRQKITFS